MGSAYSAATISAAAATGRAERRVGTLFDRFDEDGDGRIALADIPAPRGDRINRLTRGFERFDTNGDGVLSTQEIDALPKRGDRNRGERPRAR